MAENYPVTRLNVTLQGIKRRLLSSIRTIFGLSRNDLKSGLYMLQVTLCPILVAAVSRSSDLFAFSLLGGLFTARTDPGGLFRVRARTMALGALLLIVASASATFVRGNPVLTVGLILVWSGLASLLGVFGNLGIRLGSMTVVSLVLFLANPSDMSQVLPRGLVILASAGWAIASKLWVWPFKPNQPIRNAVADYYRILGTQFMRLYATGDLTSESRRDADIQQQCIQVQRRRNLAYLMIRDLNGHFNPTTRKMHWLVQQADLLYALQIALSEGLQAAFFHEWQAPVQRSVERVMAVVDQMLQQIGTCIRNDKPVGDTSELERARQELTKNVPTCQKKPSAEDYVALASARYVLRLLEHTLAALQRSIALIQKTDLEPSAKTAPRKRQSAGPSPAWRAWADHMTLRSPILQHALRLSVTLSIAMGLALYFHIPHGYWIPLTVAIILRPEFHATRQRARQRVGGTLTGSLIAILAAVYIQDVRVLGLLGLILLFLASSHRSRNYGTYVFFWTPMIILLLDIQSVGDGMVALQRVANTLTGGLLAMAAIYLFLPQWDKSHLPEQIAKTLAANRRFVRVVRQMYSRKPNLAIEIKPIRQQANRECINATAALQRLAGEPPSKRINDKQFSDLVLYNQQLCNILTALSLKHPLLPPGTALPGVTALLGQFDAILQAIETAIRSGQPPNAVSNPAPYLITAQEELAKLFRIRLDELIKHTPDTSHRDLVQVYLPFQIHLRNLASSLQGLSQATGA